MKIAAFLVFIWVLLSCGGSSVQPAHSFAFREQGTGWRLVHNSASSGDTLVLDLVGLNKPVKAIYFSASIDSECSWAVEQVAFPTDPHVSMARVSGLLLESGLVLRGGKSVALSGPVFRITIKANGIGSRDVQLLPIHLSVVYAGRDAVVEETLSVGQISHS